MALNRENKEVVSPLYVYRNIDGHPVLVGALEFMDDRADGFLAQFRYDQAYVDHPKAYALDPLNLPLSRASRAFTTTSRYHVLGSIFDAAPDVWGRKVISAKEGVSQLSERSVLALGRGMGSGEIYFATSPLTEAPSYPEVPHLSEIGRLAEPLQHIDEGIDFDPAWADLLVGSWDIGGARPKAVVRDDAGELWIAKFPRKKESYDRQKVEWANLKMAKDIGMNVPAHELIETPYGAVLLIKRFDRHENQKLHFISAASLISPSPKLDKRDIDRPIGQAVFSYARVADVVQRISANPNRDLQELYARMVFNVVVHNVDDHLKNTGFLREPGVKEVYRISPLYDVVTQEGSLKHMLRIGTHGRESTLENALSDVRRMRMRPDAAQAIVDRVLDVFAPRADYYAKAGLHAKEVEAVERCFSWMERRQSLNPSSPVLSIP
jgi:serine/threonine-protein kinase HipA